MDALTLYIKLLLVFTRGYQHNKIRGIENIFFLITLLIFNKVLFFYLYFEDFPPQVRGGGPPAEIAPAVSVQKNIFVWFGSILPNISPWRLF